MTLPWRETLTWMAIVLIVFLGLGFVVPHLIDFTKLRTTFESSFSAALKTPVLIKGSIDLELLPEPHLVMNKVALGSEQSGLAMAVERIEVELAAMSLLRGELHVVTATMERPVVSVTLQADGTFPALPDYVEQSDSGTGVWSGTVEDLRIRDGEVILRKAPGTQPFSFRKLQLQAQAGAFTGPWRVEGAADFQNHPVAILLTSGTPDGSGMLRTRMNITSKLDGVKSVIDGKIGIDKTFKFDGKISVAGKMKWPDVGGLADQPWSITTEARINGRSLDLRTITLEGGGDTGAMKIEGSGLGTIGANGAISARLEAKQIDLDRPMTGEGVPAPRLAQVVEAWKTAIVGVPRDPSLVPILDISLAVDGMVLGGDSLTNVDMAMRIDQKGITISRANASLPGDATVKVKGVASLEYGGSFSGHVALDAKDAPHLFGWLESESSGRSSRVGDAKHLSVDTDLSLSPFNFGASNLKLAIDKSVMTGLVTYNLPEQGARGKLIAQFYSERLLLEQVPDARVVTSRLNGIDIELTIRADNVEVPKAAGSQAGKMVLKASASENGIVIDALDIADLGGASVKASGRLTAAGEKIELKIDAPNAAPLMALVKKLIPGNVPVYLSDRAKALSPLKLAINAERGADPMATVKFNFDGSASTTGLKGQGQIKGIAEDPDITMKFDASTTDAVQALRQFGFDVVPLPLDGGAKLSGSIEGRYSQGLVINFVNMTGGNSVEGNWRADLVQSKMTGSLTAASPDIVPLFQILSLPVPDPSQRMPFKLQSKLELAGKQIKFNDVKGTWISQPVSGAFTFDNELDRLEGRLETDQITLGTLASLSIGTIGAPIANSIWSSTRFAPPAAPPFDVNIDLAAKRIDLANGKYAENAKAKLHWQQDGVEIRDFDGAFLKGRLTGSLTLRRQGSLANYILKAKSTNLPIGAVMPNGQIDGVVDLDVDGSGSGDALTSLVSSFSGGGNLLITKGEAAKLDLNALNSATEKLDADKDPIDGRKVRDQFASLLERGNLSLGGTNASITISNGVARIGPVQISRTPYVFQGTINGDLRTMKIDSRFNLYTDQGPANWSGPNPQAAIAFRTNSQNAIEREIDVSTLTNILTTRQVSRELQRLEAQQKEQLRQEMLQFDQREKTFFDKRVKVGRDLEERAKKQAEAAKIDPNFLTNVQKLLAPLQAQPLAPGPAQIPLPPLPKSDVPLPPLSFPSEQIVSPESGAADDAAPVNPYAAP